jgi:site-specific recombinase XerD
LEWIGNPFKQTEFNSSAYLENPVENGNADLEYTLKFLYNYNGSTVTYNSYRRELERLLQWAWRIEQISILKLKRELIEEFIRFCIDPPKAWIGTKNVARYKNSNQLRVANPDWRPFVVSISNEAYRKGIQADTTDFNLSQSAIKAIFTALSSFYVYLMQENLTETNPVSLIKQKNKFVRKDQHKPVVRRISRLQWDYVIETAELLAKDSPGQHERTLFIINCLLSMYLRISELVADERARPMMGDFKKDNDANWWFNVTGKANKNKSVTVYNDMLLSLKRYRLFLGMTALPTPNEQTPLVSKVKGKGSMTSTRQIRRIVQNCFDLTFLRMKQNGHADDTVELEHTTVHWLRHTGISEDVKIRPREHVRNDAGHASMQTTDRYIDSDARERHSTGKRKVIHDSV